MTDHTIIDRIVSENSNPMVNKIISALLPIVVYDEEFEDEHGKCLVCETLQDAKRALYNLEVVSFGPAATDGLSNGYVTVAWNNGSTWEEDICDYTVSLEEKLAPFYKEYEDVER